MSEMLDYLKFEMQLALVGVTDEYEQMKIKLHYNKLINEQWLKERAEKNSLTHEEQLELVGTKVNIGGQTKLTKRVLKHDGNEFFVKLDGGKAIVEYNPEYAEWKVKHYQF